MIVNFMHLINFLSSWGSKVIQGASWVWTFLLMISYSLGGFLATHFAKENKILYGFM